MPCFFSWRASCALDCFVAIGERSDAVLRTAMPRNDAGALRELVIFNCQTARASFVARMERSEIRELSSRQESRITLALHPGYRSSDARHRPVFSPAPGRAGRPVPQSPRRGVRNDRAFHRARGAMCEHMASVCFRTRQNKQPRKRLNARVPHANGFRGLLHVPGVVACADAPRSCELSPGHALGPSARVAGVCPPSARFKDLRSTKASFRVPHRSGHPHPAPRCEDSRDAPLIGAGWRR